MPLKLYAREQILEACLAVFARHGYNHTSAAMLAEAAGISKALIFHHFKSKRELYLLVLHRCIEKFSQELALNTLPEHKDFFAAINEFSRLKLAYYQKYPDEYKVVREAFYNPPDELKAEIEQRFGTWLAARNKMLEQLFSKVSLREGVERRQALELIKIVLDYMEEKYLAVLKADNNLDPGYWEGIIDEMNTFLAMVRYGIER
ncbi:MAG: TetR/AcrR family transcriptional regulator [Desulfurispora sp.]|uniref:TetR/AcrR family transcriptional regulator n=1 Tax=Desulfurispora sp. TaxID=3014275 RepID=UPI00404AAD39